MTRRRTIPILVAAAVLGLLTSGGCRNDEFVAPVERPPLLFRSSVPADSTEGFYEPDGLTLSLTFRREVFEGDVTTSLVVPRPLSAGAQVFGRNSPREWLYEDVVFDPDVNTYRWLVDGPSMLGPLLITFHPGEPTALSGRIPGELKIGAPYQDADGVVVYALRRIRRGGEAPLDSLLGLPISAITLVRAESPGTEGVGFVVSDLILGDPYLLVAVLDTNGDGRTVPGEDWWGYPRTETLEPMEVLARSPYDATPVVFEIARPGVFDLDRFR